MTPPLHHHPKSRTRTRSRRLSACSRHPSQPITGFCPLCLHDRLSGLQSAADPSTSAATSRPELRRSKSVSISHCEASSEPRRHSCDVRGKNTLSHLFEVDDECKDPNREIKVESKRIGFSNQDFRKENVNRDEIRACEDVFGVENDEIEDLKTMKEHIDLELQNSKSKLRDFSNIAGSFRFAASSFSKKLQKWRMKSSRKKDSSEDVEVGSDRIARKTQSEVGEYGLGRRSCDTEPRFSVDANRISVDDVRFSFDEPRASWDGYLIARTIPRLTPMLSGVENMMLTRSEEQMDPIREDETTSGLSAQSNSDSSSSVRRSSFDRTSSIISGSMKALGVEVDEAKIVANSKVSPANPNVFGGRKLVITEKELKDWHLNSLNGDQSKSFDSVPMDGTDHGLIGFKKLTRWRMPGNKWGFKSKLGDKKKETFRDLSEKKKETSVESGSQDLVVEPYKEEYREVDIENGVFSGMLTRSSSCVVARNPCKPIASVADGIGKFEKGECARKGAKELVLERNKSTKYSPSNFDNGLLRFYLTPFRSHRSKSGKGRLKNSSPAIDGEVLRLN